jgi:hypothetical protein
MIFKIKIKLRINIQHTEATYFVGFCFLRWRNQRLDEEFNHWTVFIKSCFELQFEPTFLLGTSVSPFHFLNVFISAKGKRRKKKKKKKK